MMCYEDHVYFTLCECVLKECEEEQGDTNCHSKEGWHT